MCDDVLVGAEDVVDGGVRVVDGWVRVRVAILIVVGAIVAGGVEEGEVEIVEVDVLVGAGLEARGGAVVGVAVAMMDVVAAFVSMCDDVLVGAEDVVGDGVRVVDGGVRVVDGGVRVVDGGVRVVDAGVRSVDDGVWGVDVGFGSELEDVDGAGFELEVVEVVEVVGVVGDGDVGVDVACERVTEVDGAGIERLVEDVIGVVDENDVVCFVHVGFECGEEDDGAGAKALALDIFAMFALTASIVLAVRREDAVIVGVTLWMRNGGVEVAEDDDALLNRDKNAERALATVRRSTRGGVRTDVTTVGLLDDRLGGSGSGRGRSGRMAASDGVFDRALVVGGGTTFRGCGLGIDLAARKMVFRKRVSGL
jgi:hypothetical protein